MKRLILLLAGLSLVSCDSGTKEAEGTSSETQSSLQALATRLGGLRAETATAGTVPLAARGAVDVSDSSTWTDLWASSSTVGYLKANGAHRILLATAETNTFTSASTYTTIQTQLLANRFARSAGRTWWQVMPCSDGNPPPYCRAVVPGTRQMSWGTTTFRNGVILTPVDSVDSWNSGYILDGRWTLRDDFGYDDPDNLWWQVFENGCLIGRAKQKGRSFSMGIDEDTFLNTLAEMTIYDLAGTEIAPDRSKVQERIVFPEDSLGLSIDSMRIDPDEKVLRLRFSWRFDPLWGLPDSDSAELVVNVSDESCVEGETCAVRRTWRKPTRSATGSDNLVIPLDSISRLAGPTRVWLGLTSHSDSLVGTRSQTRRNFFADFDTIYSTANVVR